MADLSVALANHFGLKGKAVKERGSYFIANHKVCRTNAGPREITAKCVLLESLEKTGFARTDIIKRTPSGTPYVNLGRDMFVAVRHIPGREPDINSDKDMGLILKAMAGFHAAGRKVNIKELPVAPPLTVLFEKLTASLGAALKQIMRRPRMSDMDVSILKHADFFTERAKRSADLLLTTPYMELYKNAVSNKHVCHNNLKEENLPIFEGGCYITGFDDAAVDLQLTDIAAFIRRYAGKSDREIPIETHIANYESVSPLPAGSARIICAMLQFPWQFMKLVKQYYSKKRNFTPAGVSSRLEEILSEQEAYENYCSQGASLG